MVRVDHGLQGAGRLDVDHHLARSGGAAVPDAHGDGLLARRGSGILVGEQAVAADLDLVLFVVRFGVHQDEVVAVRIGPVGEDVLADGLALLHEHGGGVAAFEERSIVLVRADDVERDASGGGEAAAVGGVVAEGLGARLGVGGDGDLEGGTAVDVLEATGLGTVAADRGCEDVAVGVRVVVEHGEDGGAARATPTASGLVSGGRLGLVRSGRMLTVLLSADSWSWSLDWFLGGTTSSQLLTSCMFWFTSHTLPEFTSLRTTRSRFTRNTYDGDALAFGTATFLSSGSFTQSPT